MHTDTASEELHRKCHIWISQYDTLQQLRGYTSVREREKKINKHTWRQKRRPWSCLSGRPGRCVGRGVAYHEHCHGSLTEQPGVHLVEFIKKYSLSLAMRLLIHVGLISYQSNTSWVYAGGGREGRTTHPNFPNFQPKWAFSPNFLHLEPVWHILI